MKSYFVNSSVYNISPSNESYRLGRYKDGKYRLVSVRNSNDKLDVRRAISDSIRNRLGTQRFEELIYDSHYGVNWDKFIGRSYSSSVIAEMVHEIREAMLMMSNVTDCSVKIEQSGINKFAINVEVFIDGNDSIKIQKDINL